MKRQDSQRNKVLVVEDDAGWRSILSELLVDAGHEVRLCASFGDALGYLRREKFILAVVDLSLTEGSCLGDRVHPQNIWRVSIIGQHQIRRHPDHCSQWCRFCG